MRKTGKIINTEKNKVYIITENNEFVTLEKHEVVPVIGEPYSGEVSKSFATWKYFLVIAFTILLLFSIKKFYLDNRYDSSVIVDMNCSIKMVINGSGIVKKVEGISSGGYKINGLVALEHKSINEALHLILDESIKLKYLTKAHADDGFKISIFISGNKNRTPINLTEFKKYAGIHNFKVLINNNGEALID
ncbi:MAG TPA: hypothetical protein VIM70_22220 [Clostridium sp.]|uniref:anti-sigma-I factor RsgI family protein n=1 Tax=Clostridium sp. TaxID=1506 RepID=UPI002F91FCC4